MSRNPGKIFRLEDGRLCILYKSQPLKDKMKKIILTLVDENHMPLLDPKDKHPQILLKDAATFEHYMSTTTEFIGFVD
jgi:hypothetical protein